MKRYTARSVPADVVQTSSRGTTQRRLRAAFRHSNVACELGAILGGWDALLGVLGLFEGQAAADNFMPLMAAVVIRARPPQL